jgi:ubiquinol-cytochrome c reductase cytochrome c subunit
MGTGRMPMAAPGVQAGRNHVLFTQEQISQIAAYIASLGAGPSVPTEADYDYSKADPAKGQQIFSVNCAMCHNSAGAGGALTRGKYAPSLMNVDPKHIYEAMETGPQSMPVFNDQNLNAEAKRDVIAYLKNIEQSPTPGGLRLGSLGPVPEGLFAWVFGLGILVGCAIWLGKKAA